MKKLFFPVVMTLFIGTTAFNIDNEVTPVAPAQIALGEFLYTVTLQKEIPLEDAQTRWYHEYLEPGVNDSLFEPLIEMILNHQVDAYEPLYPFTKKLNHATAVERIQRMDSLMIEDPENPGIFDIRMVKNDRHASDIVSITFHETWTYDASTLGLTKTVLGIIPNVDWGWLGDETHQVRPTVYVPISNQPSSLANVSVPGVTYDFHPDGKENFYRFRTEFLCRDESVNANQEKAARTILNDVTAKSAGKSFVMYDPEFPFAEQVSKSQKEARITKMKASNMFLFYEDWEFDARQRVFRKKVKGIIPALEKKTDPEDEKEEWLYDYSAMIPMNGYVPLRVNPDFCMIDRISYDVIYEDQRVSGVPYTSAVDSMKLDSMAMDINEHVRRMEIRAHGTTSRYDVYEPFVGGFKQLSKSEVYELFFHADSVLVENEHGDFELKVQEFELGDDLNCGFRFFEKWKFDFGKQSFSKETPYVGIDRIRMEDWVESGLRIPMQLYFYKNPVTSPETITQYPYLIRANVVSGCLLNRNEFSYTDGEWGDTVVNYYDGWAENIDPSKRYTFIQPVIESVRSGKMKPYVMADNERTFSASEFEQMMTNVAARNQIRLKPGMEYVLFNQLYFHEQWYYNKVTGQIYKEAYAITFAHRGWDRYDQDSYRGTPVVQQCFTIRLNPVK